MGASSLKANRCRSIRPAVCSERKLTGNAVLWHRSYALRQSFYLHYNISERLPAAISKMSTKMTWRGIPLPPPVQRSVGVLGPVLFPILSVGSSARQLNAQTVAGPLPKSISTTWHVRPHRQRVLASESSVFLKPSPQGRRAYARCRREAAGFTWPGENILWNAHKEKKKKCPRQMLSLQDSNVHLIS